MAKIYLLILVLLVMPFVCAEDLKVEKPTISATGDVLQLNVEDYSIKVKVIGAVTKDEVEKKAIPDTKFDKITFSKSSIDHNFVVTPTGYKESFFVYTRSIFDNMKVKDGVYQFKYVFYNVSKVRVRGFDIDDHILRQTDSDIYIYNKGRLGGVITNSWVESQDGKHKYLNYSYQIVEGNLELYLELPEDYVNNAEFPLYIDPTYDSFLGADLNTSLWTYSQFYYLYGTSWSRAQAGGVYTNTLSQQDGGYSYQWITTQNATSGFQFDEDYAQFNWTMFVNTTKADATSKWLWVKIDDTNLITINMANLTSTRCGYDVWPGCNLTFGSHYPGSWDNWSITWLNQTRNYTLTLNGVHYLGGILDASELRHLQFVVNLNPQDYGNTIVYKLQNMTYATNNFPVVTDVDLHTYSDDGDNDINVTWTATDSDGGNLSINHTMWFVNSTNVCNNTEVLDQRNFSIGDSIICSVRVYDGSHNSSWMNSSRIVLNYDQDHTVNVSVHRYVNITIQDQNHIENYTTSNFLSMHTEEYQGIVKAYFYTNSTAKQFYQFVVSDVETDINDSIVYMINPTYYTYLRILDQDRAPRQGAKVRIYTANSTNQTKMLIHQLIADDQGYVKFWTEPNTYTFITASYSDYTDKEYTIEITEDTDKTSPIEIYMNAYFYVPSNTYLVPYSTKIYNKSKNLYLALNSNYSLIKYDTDYMISHSLDQKNAYTNTYLNYGGVIYPIAKDMHFIKLIPDVDFNATDDSNITTYVYCGSFVCATAVMQYVGNTSTSYDSVTPVTALNLNKKIGAVILLILIVLISVFVQSIMHTDYPSIGLHTFAIGLLLGSVFMAEYFIIPAAVIMFHYMLKFIRNIITPVG